MPGAGPDPTGRRPPAQPAWRLPDFAVCTARRKKKGGFAYCGVAGAGACEHVTRVEGDFICCHPKRKEIIARTEARQN